MFTPTFVFGIKTPTPPPPQNDLITEISAIIRTNLNPCCTQVYVKLIYIKNTNPLLLTV